MRILYPINLNNWLGKVEPKKNVVFVIFFGPISPMNYNFKINIFRPLFTPLTFNSIIKISLFVMMLQLILMDWYMLYWIKWWDIRQDHDDTVVDDQIIADQDVDVIVFDYMLILVMMMMCVLDDTAIEWCWWLKCCCCCIRL